MESPNFEITLRFLKVIAHESRLRLLGILADGEWSVWELADQLNLKEPTISHHLGKMLEIDLLFMRRVGTTHLYSLNRKTLHHLNRTLSAFENIPTPSTNADVSWEAKVLKTFVKEDQLTKIPEARKKRLVILQWLVNAFDYNMRYSEAEVNRIIKQRHPDTATLRRELIANKLMRREEGIYWRVSSAFSDAKIPENSNAPNPL